jgi:hypothetical protein
MYGVVITSAVKPAHYWISASGRRNGTVVKEHGSEGAQGGRRGRPGRVPDWLPGPGGASFFGITIGRTSSHSGRMGIASVRYRYVLLHGFTSKVTRSVTV